MANYLVFSIAIAPGILTHNFSLIVLCLGALGYGLCWGWGAYKTKSIFWNGISHTSTGIVRLLTLFFKN